MQLCVNNTVLEHSARPKRQCVPCAQPAVWPAAVLQAQHSPVRATGSVAGHRQTLSPLTEHIPFLTSVSQTTSWACHSCDTARNLADAWQDDVPSQRTQGASASPLMPERAPNSWEQSAACTQARAGTGQRQAMRAARVGEPRLLVLLLLTALMTAADAQAGPNATAPSDVAALAAFRAGLSPQQGSILANWGVSPPTDPCQSGWKGVICSCQDLPIRSLAAACDSAYNASAAQLYRVLGLDLGPVASAGGQKLQGTISPALGSLQELLFLDLSSNELTGPLPDTLSALTKLQWLLLDSNQLSGPLPAYLGALPDLKQAQLQNNNFSGPLPEPTAQDQRWCSNQAVYDVSFNHFLCGTVPTCLEARVNDIEGTYLSMGNIVGGECDTTAPDCNAEVGCVIWTPMYWTSRSTVAFNFTGFLDYETRVQRYQWGIGSKPYSADAVPLTDVTASRVLKDIKYAGGTQKMFVTPVTHNLNSISLLEGETYYVTVVAWNGAGPPLSSNQSSKPVLVDTTGPVAGTVYNTFSFQQASSTSLAQSLQTSWDSFEDAQSGVTGYVVQFFQQARNSHDDTIRLTPLTEPVAVKSDVRKLQLKAAAPLAVGTDYVAQVTATNGAGLATSAHSIAVTVVPEQHWVSAENAALIGAMCGVGCLAIGAVAAVNVMKHRVRQHRKREKQQAEDAKQLKALMFALSSHPVSDANSHDSNGPVAVQHMLSRMAAGVCDRDLAFVWTDIEGSTDLSQQDGQAFKQVQEVHDQLMREGIAKFGGYEITTEGDSFQVAFATCQAAIGFCTHMQYRLLEQSWPKRVLALEGCKAIRDPETQQVVFSGPRVRMGVHWARQGTFAKKVHSLTKNMVFQGPPINLVAEVSDISHGGQIVLTQDAVIELTQDMSQAGFPIISLLGLYQLSHAPIPTFLYCVTDVVGKPLKRTFKPLRKTKQLWPTDAQPMHPLLHFNAHPVPSPVQGKLAFVVLRLCAHAKNGKSHLTPKVAGKFLDLFATTAQQFRGYVFSSQDATKGQGVWAVAFQSSMDALRFTHAAQMLLMYESWPREAAHCMGPDVPSADGRWLFKGPRVCMAIHESGDFQAVDNGDIEIASARRGTSYIGRGVMLANILAYAARGGQVVLSETAWRSVKDVVMQHPNAVSVLSLGTHVLAADFSRPMHLMEVMPSLLTKRNFAHIHTKRQVEPGYRDAPDPSKPMAMVFMKVHKPDMVAKAEKGEEQKLPEGSDAGSLIEVFQYAVGMYAELARKLLRQYGGYECKEPEAGKFTIAFTDLEDAIRWACHLQEELVYVEWPDELAKIPGCAPEEDQSGYLIWAGPRVRIGMAWGMISTKKPLGTGRADYFGVLANCAARVMALAEPGQVLIEAQTPPLDEDGNPLLQRDSTTVTQLLNTPGCSHQGQRQGLLQEAHEHAEQLVAGDTQELPVERKDVHIHPVGFFLLRGLDHPKLLFQAETERLRTRLVKNKEGKVGEPTMPGMGALSGSFASSYSSRFNFFAFGKRSTSPTYRPPSPPFGAASSSYSIPAAMRGGLEGSRPSMSAGGRLVGLHNGDIAVHGRAFASEAGRAGMGFVARAVGGLHGSPSAAGLRGGFLGRPSSPQLLRSSQSESAAAGRALLVPVRSLHQGAYGNAVVPSIVVNAAVSEDGSGGTPAAEGRAAAQLDSTGPAPVGPGIRFASVPNMRHGLATHDPLLGTLHLARIHTGATGGGGSGDSPGQVTASSAGSEGQSPLPAVRSGPSASPLARASTSNIGMPWPAEQQTHEQLQQQQHPQQHPQQQWRQSAVLPIDGGAVCPPSVDPAAMPECPQPWQEQKEQWHERQEMLLGGGDIAVTGADGGLFRQGSTTPVSLSTTMTSCIDDELGQGTQAQQQQEAQYRVSDRADHQASLSFSGLAGGMRGVLAGVTKGVRPGRHGGSAGGASKPLSWRQLLPRLGLRRHSTSAGLPSSGGLPPSRGLEFDDDESLDEEAKAVQQQHGMLPRNSSPHSTPSHTPCSSTPGSRAGTGGGAELLSPGKLWAQDVAQAYVSSRHSSSSLSMQPSYSSNRGMDGSLGGVHAASSSQLANASRPDASAGEGSLGNSSLSRGGSYTCAESSYSPMHSNAAGGPVSVAALWQQYGHQEQLLQDSSVHRLPQQQLLQQGLPSRPSGMQLSCELSLRAPGSSAAAAAVAAAVEASDSAAAGGAVNPADVVPELQQMGRQVLQPQGSDFSLQPPTQQQQPSNAGSTTPSLDMQAHTCQHLSAAMWESVDGARQTQSVGGQQPPQQQVAEGSSSMLLQQHQEYSAPRLLDASAAGRVGQGPTPRRTALQQGTQVQQSATLQVPGSVQRQQQQQQQQPVLHVAQSPSRPSPLGKCAAKGSAQQGTSTTFNAVAACQVGQPGMGSSPVQATSQAAGSQRAGQQALAHQQAASALPGLSSVAVDAKRVIAGGFTQGSVPGTTAPGSPSQRQATGWAGATQDPPPSSSRRSSGGGSPRFAAAASHHGPGAVCSIAGSSAPGSPRASLPTTPRSAQRAALGGASFGSTAGGAPGSPVEMVASSPFLQRTGSNSSCGSPRFGATHAWAGGGLLGSADGGSDDFEDDDDEGLCVFASGRQLSAIPKETLGAIPELPPAFESRTSDPSSDKG